MNNRINIGGRVFEFADSIPQEHINSLQKKLGIPPDEQIKIDFLEKNDNMTNFYFFRSILTDDEMNYIHEVAKKYPVTDGNVSGTIDKDYRSSEIRWLPLNEDTKTIYNTMVYLAKKANKEMWKFHITSLLDDFQYTEYTAENEGHYDWHMDFGGSRSSTRKLSMVVQLTDSSEYEGGDLQFMINRSIITAPRDKGTVLFFPSYLTHRITNITKGVRNSLVSWFHGPTFV